jgi:hypothetical protein
LRFLEARPGKRGATLQKYNEIGVQVYCLDPLTSFSRSGHAGAGFVYQKPLMIWKSLLAALVFLPAFAAAQAHQHESRGSSIRLGASAIGLLTHATPASAGRDLTEGYITQPNLFLHAFSGPINFMGTINLEGLTLERWRRADRQGELNAGTWGEGYVDRRHPHTYLHEAMASAETSLGGLKVSLSAGKGFAPFGSDDPMVRPMVKFPANHHLAQILERLVVIGAVRRGPAIVEVGAFNGDEPLNAKSVGQIDRFGDSWSARVTLLPLNGYELQASHARVESPEVPEGGSLDQRKWSVSLRHERRHEGGGHYFLIEWMRTAEMDDDEEVLVLHSALGEASLQRGPWQGAVRIERTIRPEEERTTSIFRSPWPHIDEVSFGMTRWVNISANVSRELEVSGLKATPILEVGQQRPTPTFRPSLFEPERLYGSDQLWSVSLGVRLALGASHERMGRYGVTQNITMH